MSELGKRVAVAAVGIPAVLGLAYLGGWALGVPLALFAALGARELYRMAAAKGVDPLGPLGVVAAGALPLLAAWHGTFVAFAPWALGALGLLAAAGVGGAIASRGPEREPLAAVAVTVLGSVYAGLSLAFAALLHALPEARGWTGASEASAAGLAALALPLATTWVGDSAAYFAGRAFGRSKLAPTISPNKSWVGFWAGVCGAALAAVAWEAVVRAATPGLALGWAAAAAVGAALGVAAVLGDLAESLFKRGAGVKDSGSFFPGHGGVLDRLDALIATVPLSYVALALLGGPG